MGVILKILDDGQWHTLEEVRKQSDLSETQIDEVIAFLREYDFVVFDKKNKRIRLEEMVQRFLTHATP
jgi:biotin operon repressor